MASGGEIGRDACSLLGRGGRLLSFGAASGAFTAIAEDELAARGVTQVRGTVPDPQQMTALTVRALASAAAAQLCPVIGQTFALADADEAHRAIEARSTIGKTLLQP